VSFTAQTNFSNKVLTQIDRSNPLFSTHGSESFIKLTSFDLSYYNNQYSKGTYIIHFHDLKVDRFVRKDR
jgi:hypothetical protein